MKEQFYYDNNQMFYQLLFLHLAEVTVYFILGCFVLMFLLYNSLILGSAVSQTVLVCSAGYQKGHFTDLEPLTPPPLWPLSFVPCSDIKEHVKQIEKAVSGKEPRFRSTCPASATVNQPPSEHQRGA